MTDTLATRWPGVAQTPRTPFKARVAKAVVRPAINTLPVRLTFPDGTVWGDGGAAAPEMQIRRPAAFFSRLGHDTKIGFGEAYMAGDWTEGPDTDLAAVGEDAEKWLGIAQAFAGPAGGGREKK